MRVLIASDSHGDQEKLYDIFSREHFDAFFFCGDGEGLEDRLLFMPGCPPVTAMVKGNNDFGSFLREEVVLHFDGHRIFLTHGHRYRLYAGTDLLLAKAKQEACDICLFGHTHRPFSSFEEGVLLINPGSLSLPRQEGRIPTCAVLETASFEGISLTFHDARNMRRLCSYSEGTQIF